MSPRTRRVLNVIVAGGVTMVLIAVGVQLLRWSGQRGRPDANAAPVKPATVIEEPLRPAGEPNRAATEPNRPAAASAASQPAVQPSEAKQAYGLGLALLAEGKLVPARTALSRAFFSKELSAQEEARAIKELALLADKTVLSREYIDGDPYNIPYTVKPRETIEGNAGIEMTHRLHVPSQLILKVNGLSPGGASLRAGQTIKLVKGPFHAVVYKDKFIMDIYLQREEEGLEKVFIRRILVGLGINSSTPVGPWRVKQGKSREPPTYYATPGSGLTPGTPIRPDQPGYPFGKKALWIRLEGTDTRTAGIDDFGIHSTNDPNSIGRANSLGCIRMADDDIELVFSLLYDVHSRVDVVP